jgi:hypothetical protein
MANQVPMGVQIGRSRPRALSRNKTAPNPNCSVDKNSPDSKRNDPQINWPAYKKGYGSEGYHYPE